MSKQEMIAIIKTFSAIESLLMASGDKRSVPDYLFEQISAHCEMLEKVVLQDD